MNKKALATLAASILLASSYPCVQEARAQNDSNSRCMIMPVTRGFRLDLLVDGMPLNQIHRHGRTYVEAPWDKDFDIRITCPTGQRYLAVCSVDGLSIMTGKTASSSDDGYVIDNGSVTVPGFRLTDANVAHFHFGDKSKSYANLVGKPTNIGVIGLKIFADANRRIGYTSGCDREQNSDSSLVPRPVRGYGGMEERSEKSDFYKAPAEAQIIDGSLLRKGSPMTNPQEEANKYEGDSIASAQSSPGYVIGKKQSPRVQSLHSNLDHDMGTEFGARTEFLTNTVDFARGAQLASIAIEYASHEKLVQAGIIPGGSLPIHPNPFPADSTGCMPPPGWRG